MTQLGKLTVPVEAETSKFVREMARATAAMGKFAEAAEKSGRTGSRAQSDLSKALKGTATELNSVWSIAQRVTGVFQTLFDAANQGAQNAAAETFFRNAGHSLQEFRDATRGMISDAELMKKVNLAESMGISEGTFKTLSKVATAAALKTGQSFDFMFESIVKGTARSSRLLLDNLGIIVSASEANLHYAESLKSGADAQLYKGMTTKQLAENLSDYAKKVAFAAEVERQSLGTVEEMGRAHADAAERMAQVSASLQNMAEETKSALADIAFEWTKIFDRLVEVEESWLGKTFRILRDAATGVKLLLQGDLLSLFMLDDFSVEVDPKSAKSMKLYTEQLMDMHETLRTEFGFSQFDIADMLQLDPASEAFADLDKTVQAYVQTMRKLNKELHIFDMYEPPERIDPSQILKPKEERAGREAKMSYNEDVLREIMSRSAVFGGNVLGTPFGKFGEDTPGAVFDKANYQKVIDQENAEIMALLTAAIEKDNKVLEERSAGFAQSLTELENEALAAAYKLSEIARGKAGAQRITNPLGEALSGGGLGGFISLLSGGVSDAIGTAIGTATGGAIGAIIGFLIDLVGPILAGLDPVVKLLTSVSGAIGAVIKVGLEPLLHNLDPLSRAISLLGVALGRLVYAFVANGGVISGILNVLVTAIASVINGLSFLIMAISPFVEIIWSVAGFFEPLFTVLSEAVGTSTVKILDAGIALYNGVIQFVRHLGDDASTDKNESLLKDFGDLIGGRQRRELLRAMGLDVAEEGPPEFDEHSDAVRENTKAVRDLAREFRNLPSGYKIAGADFATSRGTPRPIISGRLEGAAADFVNQRAGDQYRWWR